MLLQFDRRIRTLKYYNLTDAYAHSHTYTYARIHTHAHIVLVVCASVCLT
jgi:hypothetical protein